MEWILGFFAGVSIFLLAAKDDPKQMAVRLEGKESVLLKLRQMLHIRKGFEIGQSIMTFPFVSHPRLEGIALDKQNQSLCLFFGNFMKEEITVHVMGFDELKQIEVWVDGLRLDWVMGQEIEVKESPLSDMTNIQEVLLKLKLNNRSYPEHQVNFIEKAKGHGAEAVVEAKKWCEYLVQIQSGR
jgi:hypothetical protein